AAGFYEYAPALFDQAGFTWNGPPIDDIKASSGLWPDFHHAADLVAAGELVDFLDDEVAASFSFFGTADDVADQIRDLVAGVPSASIIVPHPIPMPGPDEVNHYIDWLGDGPLAAVAR
ncbi:MAG: hypothetical protein AAFO29_26765, partial [Actinomycetota bacterium]